MSVLMDIRVQVPGSASNLDKVFVFVATSISVFSTCCGRAQRKTSVILKFLLDLRFKLFIAGGAIYRHYLKAICS